MRKYWERKRCADGYYFASTMCGKDLNNGQKFQYATEFDHGVSVVYDYNFRDKWVVIDSHGKFVNETKAKIYYKFGDDLQYAVVWIKCLGFNIVSYDEGFIFDKFVDNIEKIELTDSNAFKIKRIREIGIRSIEIGHSIECSFEYNLFTVDGKIAFDKWAKSIAVTRHELIKTTEFDGTFSLYDNSLHLLYCNLTCFSPLPNDCYKIGKEFDSDKRKYNVIDEYGELLSYEWFDAITDPTDFVMIVRKDDKNNHKYNLMSYFGDIIQKEWFDNIIVNQDKFPWCELFGKYRVFKDNKTNMLTNKGELFSSLWADTIVYSPDKCWFHNIDKEDFSIKFNLDEK